MNKGRGTERQKEEGRAIESRVEMDCCMYRLTSMIYGSYVDYDDVFMVFSREISKKFAYVIRGKNLNYNLP